MTKLHNEGCTFNEYENFIYINTTLTREEARIHARDCWNQGLDKHEALRRARA